VAKLCKKQSMLVSRQAIVFPQIKLHDHVLDTGA